MKKPIKLLIHEKLRIEESLDKPMNILSALGQEEHVTWKSFHSKKEELEKELDDVTEALLKLDPKKEFH
jgi:hypothetical protein